MDRRRSSLFLLLLFVISRNCLLALAGVTALKDFCLTGVPLVVGGDPTALPGVIILVKLSLCCLPPSPAPGIFDNNSFLIFKLMSTLVNEVLEALVNGLLVEDVCACIKERLLEYGVCMHCGKVHAEEKTEEYFGEDDVECKDCGKKMAASRFASHLEKCLSSSENTSNNTSNSSNNNKKRKQK